MLAPCVVQVAELVKSVAGVPCTQTHVLISQSNSYAVSPVPSVGHGALHLHRRLANEARAGEYMPRSHFVSGTGSEGDQFEPAPVGSRLR